MRFKCIFITALICALISGCASEGSQTEIYPIQDNPAPRLMARTLFADVPDSLFEALGLNDGIPSSVCAFLVRAEGRQILFDAANGADDSRLMPVLDSLGTAPEDIDYVFITHLHGDHTGGLLKDDAAAFPNAVIYINKIEYDSWISMDGNGRLQMIADAYDGRIVTFMPEDSLPCGVKALAAYGHTPGHTIYLLDDILIAGDIMHGVALQKEHPEFCARFDMDSDAAVNSRRAVLQMASEGNLKVYGMHFPAPYHL